MKIHQISFHENGKILSGNKPESQSKAIGILAQEIMDLLRDKQMGVGFAESCTGGLLSSELTKIPGASDVFWGAIVSYANSVKSGVLGVSQEVLDTDGAVSARCAEQMAAGALKTLGCQIAVSITGVAGPKSGSAKAPVGTVFITVAGMNKAKDVKTETFQHDFGQTVESISEEVKEDNSGEARGFTRKLGREEIQRMACAAALKHLKEFLKED